jgi:membrane protein
MDGIAGGTTGQEALMGTLDRVKRVVGEAVDGWGRHETARTAAALSYFGSLSLAPTLVVFAAVALALGREQAIGRLLDQLAPIIGQPAVDVIASAATALLERTDYPIAPLLFSVVIALAGATGLAIHLRRALRTVWEAPTESSDLPGAVKGAVVERGIAAVVLGALFVAVACSLAVLAAFQAVSPAAVPWLNGAAETALGSVLLFGVLLAVYRWMPGVAHGWVSSVAGAALCAAVMTIGSQFAGWYFSQGWFYSVYGAAGSLVVVLTWLYWCATAFLAGAEMCAGVERTRG